MKLQSKISLIVVPLIAVPLLSVGVLAYLELWASSKAQSQAQVAAHIGSLAEEYASRVRDARMALDSLANDPLLMEYLLTEDEEYRYALMQRPLLRRLASYQAANPAFYEIRLLQPDGFEELRMVNSALPNTTEDESQTPFFRALPAQAEDFGEFVGLNPDSGELTLFVSRRVRLRNEAVDAFDVKARTRGVLSISQDLGHLASRSLPPPWEAGRVLFTDREGRDYQHPSAAAFEDHHGEASHAAYEGGWHRMIIDGEPVMHHQLQLSSNLYLHTLLPERVLHASGRRIGGIVLGIIALALITSVPLLLWLLRRQILQPIQHLNQALETIGKQQDRLQLESRAQDEIGDLFSAFNRMSIDLYESNEQVRNLAFLDALTGLPNRALFRRNLTRAIANARRSNKQMALLFLDLDNFKHVNDNLGHAAGDKLLQQISQRLVANLRGGDLINREGRGRVKANFSRLGGDEFTVLLPDLASAHQAGTVAKRLVEAIAQPINIEEHQVYVGASIGIALWPHDAASEEELIANADLAMYQAKHKGKNSYRYFSQSIGELSRERARIMQRLHYAAEHGDFTLYYQPIVDSQSLRLLSFEALLRWNDEELGPVPPDRFIPIAEEDGLIHPIGRWVLDETCRQLRQWQEQGHRDIRVGVNLSGLQLSRTDIVAEVRQSLARHRVDSRSIYVELTETAVLQGEQQVIQNLQGLRKLGIQVALDDFGTGYSSLSHLRNLPIDILKIDRSFILDLDQGNNSIVLSAIITMAHALGLKVVAEGVETEAHLSFLAKEGCDMTQGYLFSRPCPADAAIALQIDGVWQTG